MGAQDIDQTRMAGAETQAQKILELPKVGLAAGS